MKNKLLLMIFLSAVSIAKAYSQLPPFSIGFKVGPTYSYINDLETTISPRPINSTIYVPHTIEKQKRWGGSAGLYGLWTLKGDEVNEERVTAIQVQILYASQGGNLIYQENGFNYKMEFRYNYINIPVDVKVFPFGFVTRNNDWPNYFTGLNLGVGAQLGINITSENIVYTSNISQPIAGTDLNRQQELRKVLKGRDNFGFRASIGYEFICGAGKSYMNKGISLELNYYLGLTDVVETLPSFEKFIETRNRNKCWQITLGVDFKRLKQFLNNGYSSCY